MTHKINLSTTISQNSHVINNKIFLYWRLDKLHNRGEIGYVLNPSFWGFGFMKETMNTLIRFGFNELKLHSVEANVNTENEKSKKLLLSVGFKLEALPGPPGKREMTRAIKINY